MAHEPQKLTIFVASPGDVAAERDAVSKAVADFRSAPSPGAPVIPEVIRWETHSWPSFGTDAQDVINQQLPVPDIFVGVLWRRFGTPTGRAQSGTEEEFTLAFNSWKKLQRPQILFYFSRQPYRIETEADLAQVELVLKFRRKIVENGALIWEYESPAHFAELFAHHLALILKQRLPEAPEDQTLASIGHFLDHVGDHRKLLNDLGRHRADADPVGLIYVDVDNLASFNTEHGDVAGDELLSAITGRLRVIARGKASVYRVSGDEFALLLPNSITDEAAATAERVRSDLERLPFSGVSVTCGYAASDLCGEAPRLYRFAREAMVVGKELGKNLCAGAPLSVEGRKALKRAQIKHLYYS